MSINTFSWGMAGVLVLFVLTALGAEQAPSAVAPSSARSELRQREGAAFESEGYMQFTGERMTFVSADGEKRLVLLENLALDRVGRSMRDSTTKPRWKVFGTLTEYQGANYLLLSRAMMMRQVEE